MLLLLLAASLLSAADWPRFRGPNGSGVDSSTALPVEFGPAKNVAWKTAVPFGRSSPIVAGNRVFLTASEGDSLLTLAYDSSTGRELWRNALKRTHNHKIYKANDPASPTPAADDQGVYVFFPDFGLVSYTHQGKERWRHPLGPFDNFYGMSSSPIVAGGLLIFLCDQLKGSFLLALDKDSGRQRWKTGRPTQSIGWSIPIVHQSQILTFGSTRIDSYYLSTGEQQWWSPIASNGSMGSPVIHGENVIVAPNGSDQPWLPSFESALAKLDKDKDGRLSREESKDESDWFEHFGWLDADHDGFISAAEWREARSLGLGDYGVASIPLSGGPVKWRFKRNLPYVAAPVLYNGVLFMVKDGGIVTSLDPATGALLKQGRTEKAPGVYFASPVAAAGKVFLLSEEGKLTVLKAAPQWEVLAVNDLGEESYATPAISNGKIYIRTRGNLYCFTTQ